jgi:hypothetical protein
MTEKSAMYIMGFMMHFLALCRWRRGDEESPTWSAVAERSGDTALLNISYAMHDEDGTDEAVRRRASQFNASSPGLLPPASLPGWSASLAASHARPYPAFPPLAGTVLIIK